MTSPISEKILAGKSLRIGLVSPYTGGNLGDAAIIESARAHLTIGFPGAHFLLIVIRPESVAAAHGLEAFPLTAVPRSFYYAPGPACNPDCDGAATAAQTQSAGARVRSFVKTVAHRCLPFALPTARRARTFIEHMDEERSHLREAKDIMASLDALVIAGGGQFDDEWGGAWGHPYAMYKWITLAQRHKVPVHFAGVGVCEIRHFLTRWFLRHALKKADRVSLRDAGSASILRSIGISQELLPCPDLAFGLPLNSKPLVGARTISGTVIGFSPIVYALSGSWPTSEDDVFQRYWKELTAFALLLVRKGFVLKLFATDLGDQRLVERLRDFLLDARVNPEQVHLVPMPELQQLLDLLNECAAVVASRLHGVVLGHVSGRPVLAVSYHRKVTVHMEDMGQMDYCLDFGRFTAEEALRRLEKLLADKTGIISTIDNLCAEKRVAVEDEFKTVVAAINDSHSKHGPVSSAG